MEIKRHYRPEKVKKYEARWYVEKRLKCRFFATEAEREQFIDEFQEQLSQNGTSLLLGFDPAKMRRWQEASTLDTDFAIHWPQNIQLSPHMQNTLNRELVAKVDAGFKQVGVNMSELKGENDLLKSALADKMTHLANEVEPEYYTWMMHVLATGSVSGAAKLVGMANSTFTDKLKAYRARGGVYETLFKIHEVRRRTMGTKKMERYNDMYAAHQQSESSNDSDLLREVFEALREQNSGNWANIRSEMLEVLQDVVP